MVNAEHAVLTLQANNPLRLIFMSEKYLREHNKDSAAYYIEKTIAVCDSSLNDEYNEDMAINKTINKRTNTHGAMRNCIEYVLRQDKTNELFTCVTGPYCHDEINYDLVYRTFLEEKKMWDKDSGRMYAHNIISWHKDEQITPEQALEFGKEFAEKWFQGFQTLWQSIRIKTIFIAIW